MAKKQTGNGQAADNGVAVADGPAVNGSLPLYAQPHAVHSVSHRDVAVKTGSGDYAFAARAPMVQVTVDEVERAALDYPIVFFGADRQPYAVTGVEGERNLFVTEGQFRTGSYIPAYLRRYPFVFARDEGSDALILCLDHASDRIGRTGDEGAEALFDGDQPTALTQQALFFCESYEAAAQRTRAFTTLLDELNLFEGRQAHYAAPGAAEPTLLLDYATLDRARLDALSGGELQRLRDGGFLAASYAVTASQAQWDVLALMGG